MMNIESKSKWQIRLATLSIFLLGFVAGAIALNAYHLWFGGAKQPTKRERFEEAFVQIGLNDTQKVDVQKILGETRDKIQKLRQESEPAMQDIRSQTDEKLQKVMTEKQWLEFQQEREKILQLDKQDKPRSQLNLPKSE